MIGPRAQEELFIAMINQKRMTDQLEINRQIAQAAEVDGLAESGTAPSMYERIKAAVRTAPHPQTFRRRAVAH